MVIFDLHCCLYDNDNANDHDNDNDNKHGLFLTQRNVASVRVKICLFRLITILQMWYFTCVKNYRNNEHNNPDCFDKNNDYKE